MYETSDAYGHEVWDFLKKGEGYEIIERDDGFIDESGGPEAYFATFDKWPSVEKRAIKYAKGRVLDIGCGAGRVALYLQNEKGLDVLGIDNSPLAIKVSKLRGLRKAKLLAFQNINFKPASFDTVIMFGNNFGLFANRTRAKRLLRKLYTMTSPEAVLLCESLDPYKTRNPDHLAYQRENRRIGRMSGQIRIRARYRTFIGKWFDYLLVSQKEMEEILKGTGWSIDRFICSDKSPVNIGLVRRSC